MSNFFDRQHIRERALSRDTIGRGLTRMGQPPVVLPDGRVVDASQVIQIARGLTFPFTATQDSQLMLPVDTDRKFLFIENNDALGVIWVSYGVANALGVGMRFSSGGGGILLDNNVPTAAVYVIGTIANNPNITIITG